MKPVSPFENLSLLLALALLSAGCAASPEPIAALALPVPAALAADAAFAPATARPVRAFGRLVVKSARALLATPVDEDARKAKEKAAKEKAEKEHAAAAPTIVPFARQYLTRVDVYLTALAGDSAGTPELVDSLTAPDLERRLEFSILPAGKTYRITLKAWQPEYANIPDVLVEAQDDALSVTTFAVEPDSSIDLDKTLGGIKLVLKDRTFHGRAPGSINVTAGGFENTTAAEGVAE